MPTFYRRNALKTVCCFNETAGESTGFTIVFTTFPPDLDHPPQQQVPLSQVNIAGSLAAWVKKKNVMPVWVSN